MQYKQIRFLSYFEIMMRKEPERIRDALLCLLLRGAAEEVARRVQLETNYVDARKPLALVPPHPVERLPLAALAVDIQNVNALRHRLPLGIFGHALNALMQRAVIVFTRQSV